MAQIAYNRLPTTLKTRQVASTTRYDWVMLFLSTWIIVGFYSDAFAHAHKAVDSFFTPWHGTIYSGLTAVIFFDAITLVGNHLKGYSWRKAIPTGYGLSFAGAAFFAVGGVGDFIWHSLFGIEFNMDAALSPTHLTIMAASALVFIGPVCALWQRTKIRHLTWAAGFPVVFSIAYVLFLVNLVTSFLNPFELVSAADSSQLVNAEAIASFIIPTAVLLGIVLSVLRRWQLPFGSMTLFFSLSYVTMTLLSTDIAANLQVALVVVALLSGLAADLLLWQLNPGPHNIRAYRWFALLVPIITYSFYFAGVQFTAGVAWTVHGWSGLLAVVGTVGLMMSFLVFPPRLPETID